MQPLKATASPRCGSTIGCAPRSERSMTLSRRWPRPAPSWTQTPWPSGPRGSSAADIRARTAASAGRPSKRSSPAIPHIPPRDDATPGVRPAVEASLDRWSVAPASFAHDSRKMRDFDLRSMYARRIVQFAGVAPLIGVSTSEMRAPARTHALPESEPPMRELALGMSYPRSLERSGALPVVLPPMELDRVDVLLDRLGGLMISGGPDVHPAAYGEEPHPSLGPTEPDLDAFELELLRRADARGMPILGICRGEQLLNIARGGTLVQDLPEMVGGEVEHRQELPGRVPTHPIVVVSDSRLEGVLGRENHEVNSFHHHAVRELGRGLRAVAWSPDGIIEAIEAPNRDFVVGVQWHAESLAEREDQAGLFAAFVAAAARYEAVAPARAAAAAGAEAA